MIEHRAITKTNTIHFVNKQRGASAHVIFSNTGYRWNSYKNECNNHNTEMWTKIEIIIKR